MSFSATSKLGATLTEINTPMFLPPSLDFSLISDFGRITEGYPDFIQIILISEHR